MSSGNLAVTLTVDSILTLYACHQDRAMTDRFIDHVLDSVTGCVTSRVVYCFDSGHVKCITVSNTALCVLCASVLGI